MPLGLFVCRGEQCLPMQLKDGLAGVADVRATPRAFARLM